ncbi:MAG: hypothetical protein ACRDG5_06885 [Anaerolineales bacterium]
MRLARLLRWTPLGSLLVLAGAIGILGSCTMTQDLSTGLSLERSNASRCLKACTDSHSALVKSEADLHQAQIRACQGLSESERSACHEAEAARHENVMEQISSSRRDCMNNCHRQGGGHAG